MLEIFSPRALIKARGKAKITQIELGDKSGINPGQINRYEKGRSVPRAETIETLASTLGIDSDTLYIEKTE